MENNFKVIIAGGRDFNNYKELRSRCDYKLQNKEGVEIVSGLAKGADYLGMDYARERTFPIKKFKADWNKLGKVAGIYRNEDMGNYADCLIAFWDQKSTGTKHMIEYATDKGLKVKVYHYIQKYYLELSEGCYISDWEGDPGRTLKFESAKLFDSEELALLGINESKLTHPFKTYDYKVKLYCKMID
jgi:hypothetical protein